MLKGCKILALIPARGGSKGIKNKNIVDLCGKPLISYTIQSAVSSKYIDDVVVTTDSMQIAEIAVQYGAQVPFLRPAHLASDTSKTLEAVLHAIETLEEQGKVYDIVVLLQPTAPLRNHEDVDGAIEKFWENGRKPLVAVSEANEHPILMRTIDKNGELKRLLDVGSTCRRQDMSPFYRVNGSIYINNVRELNQNTSFNDNSIPYVMKKNHSIDIDEEVDLLLAKIMLNSR